MPNGYEHKKYGGHKYPNTNGTSDCEYGCGCCMGPYRSDGPLGLDPHGTCPGNPKDGKRREGNVDYEDVVSQRISDLISRANNAEERLKRVSPAKTKLAEELAAVKAELCKKKMLLGQLREFINKNT